MTGNPIITVCAVVASAGVRRATSLLQGVAFWTAALLPLVYVPLVLLDPSVLANGWLVVELLGLNVAAAVVGHGYGTTDSNTETLDPSRNTRSGS